MCTKRTKFYILLSLVAMSSLVLATGQVTAKPEKVEIDFYSLAWQPIIVEKAMEATEKYNKENPSVKVNYITGSWATARDYFLTSAAGGEMPDIMHGITPWALELAMAGYIEDLRPYIPVSMFLDIDARAWETMHHPYLDGMYAIPWCWSTENVFYNAERFRELGIQPPPRPQGAWIWDEFEKICQKATNPPEYYAFACSFTAVQSEEYLISYIWSNGEDVMHRDKQGKWVVTFGRGGQEVMERYKDLIWEHNAMPQDVFGVSGSDLMDAFMAGKWIMFLISCHVRGDNFLGKTPFEWGMAPIPYFKTRATLTQPQIYSMSAQSDHKKEAWKFLEFITNTENQASFAAGDWLLPTRKSSLVLPPFTTDYRYWDVVVDGLKYGRPYVPHPAWGEFADSVLGPTLQAMLMKKISIEDGSKKIVDEGNRILERYRRRRE